jgi:hypothetical protein
MCGEKNTGQFSDGMTETEMKRGTGMGYPEMTKFMADCVIVCFFSIWFVLSGSFYLVLSVYLSFCLFVILFPLVSTEERRVDELPVDRLRGSEFLVLYIRGVDRLGERTSTSTSLLEFPTTARISTSIKRQMQHLLLKHDGYFLVVHYVSYI